MGLPRERQVRRLGAIDDHAALLVGLASILDDVPDLELSIMAPDVDDFVRLLEAQATPIDLVLLDLRLSDGTTPTENLARLSALRLPVLAYTSGDVPGLVVEAAALSVLGMLRKSEPPAVLIEAIRTALRGEVVASADWAAALAVGPQRASVGLTAREEQVLELYAMGEKAVRVAYELGISRDTVLDHVRKIRLKYAAAGRPAHTKVDLYRRALEDGVLVVDP